MDKLDRPKERMYTQVLVGETRRRMDGWMDEWADGHASVHTDGLASIWTRAQKPLPKKRAKGWLVWQDPLFSGRTAAYLPGTAPRHFR